MVALAPDAHATATGSNKGIRIELLQVIRSGEVAGTRAPDGMEAVILVTRWRNIHPKQKVARAQLESGGDRTAGAGGLFGGGGKPNPKDMVELDVAYQVRQPGRHLWLVTGGEAHGLATESKALPNGIGPLDIFTVARFGEVREARFAWFVPKGSKDIELQFFDYDFGSIRLPVAGDAATAAKEPAGTPVDRGRLDELDVAVVGSRYSDHWNEAAAPAGWRYLVVDLLGKSIALQAGKGALVYADPTKYLWAVGDGGTLRYGQPAAAGAKTLVFTPEVPHRQSVAFLVPAKGEAYRIGIRGRAGVLSLKATAAEPAAPPAPLARATDAGTLELALLGLHWDAQVLVADLLAKPVAGGKGVEIDSAQQFLLKAGGSEFRPDPALTARLYGQPPAPFVMPPNTAVRFELAYSLPPGAEPTALRYRGFSAESILAVKPAMVSGKRGAASGLMAASAPPPPKPTTPAASESRPPSGVALGAPETPAPKPATAPPAAKPVAVARAGHPAYVPPKTPPKLMPLVLPPFDPQRAVTEKEPNDRREQATPLGDRLAATGTLSTKDRVDWFSFDVKGKPQLWTVEASGVGLRYLSVQGAGGRKMGDREVRDKTSVRLDNLQLLPGRYWVSVNNSSAGGDYWLRAIPTGRPDRDGEFEPNDQPSQAQVLRFGEPRHGLIDHRDDLDKYRFTLDGATHAALTLKPPPGTKLSLTIEGGTVRLTGNRRAKAGEPSRYAALLEAGDYLVTVRGVGGSSSESPYALRLDYLDPFDLPTDLEPNDNAVQARSLAGVHRFQGSAEEFWDPDWFQLPAVTQPTVATIRYSGDSGLNLRIAKNGSIGSGQMTEKSRNKNERVYSATLQPGVPAYLEVSTQGEYTIELALEPKPQAVASPAPEATLDIALTKDLPPIAAFRDVRQQVPLEFAVTNRGAQPRHVALEAVSEADGWRLEPTGAPPTLAPGQSATVRATLRADADRVPSERVPLFVRARASGAVSAPLQVPVQARCGAAVQSPQRFDPLPQALLGGFNVAWQALGAAPVGDSSTRKRQAQLFDGMTPLGQGVAFRRLPADITVKLAGGIMPVAGITLFPTQTKVSIGPTPFTLLASTDGATFREILRGVLEPSVREQAFALASPVEASHIRLHLHNPAGLRDGLYAALAEFKVIAAPGASPFGAKAPNIADPARGGHLVWISWPEDPSTVKALLTEAAESRTGDLDPLAPIEWVIGFHHLRAARIVGLEWQENPKKPSGSRRPAQVAIATSIEGPNGPWLPLANWELKRDANGLAKLALPAPVWARYLRFSVPSADKRTRWQFAETLRVFEQPTGKDYRSILGEWGHYRSEAFYESQLPGTATPRTPDQGGGTTRQSARPLVQAEVRTGHAKAGEREEWHRITVPAGLDRLELRFGGDGRGRLIPALENDAGNPIELVEADEHLGQRIFRANVKAGGTVWLKVAEASRSIMIVWDNSGSVSQYHDSMYKAINRLADDIKPGLEVVNLMPLGEHGVAPLMKDWSSNPIDIKAAIGGYDRSGASSNSEGTLLAAMDYLSKRPGNRAIVLLTDAESGGGSLNSVLWRRFREVRPRIFTMELQLDPFAERVSGYQDLMQDWAAVNHGDYRVFRTQADLDHAFERAACLLRRAADYTVSWHPAPGKGQLRVEWEHGKAMAGAAMELILDASGSMRSAKAKVNGKLKMDVARGVMRDIIAALPDDTKVGLRFYGHRRRDRTKGACQDSELVAPIAPLDRKRLTAAVNAVKARGSTPIAYSIARACEDLKPVKGPKLLVLITDGKEECKGDPPAAVAACRAAGVDVRVDIVGFRLANAKDKRDMEGTAAKGGGRFFDAQDRGALATAIAESLAMPFEVFDSRDQSVGRGLTGTHGQALYQGNYSVVVRTANGDVTVPDVAIREKKITTIYLARDGDAIRFRTKEAH